MLFYRLESRKQKSKKVRQITLLNTSKLQSYCKANSKTKGSTWKIRPKKCNYQENRCQQNIIRKAARNGMRHYKTNCKTARKSSKPCCTRKERSYCKNNRKSTRKFSKTCGQIKEMQGM